MAKSISLEELQKHNKATDCWVAIDGGVYDVTKFLDDHPGGKKVLLAEGGKEATKKFKMFHDMAVLAEHGKDLKVGTFAASKL